MPSLNVTPEDLHALSGQYKHQANELRSRLQSLSNQTSFLRTDWLGSASSSFQGLAADIETHQIRLIESLEGMAQILDNAAAAYESTESQVRSAFQG